MSSFKPAEATPSPIIIGIAGPSGSGKTLSALRVARGLVGPTGRIAGIDTEHGRMAHYANRMSAPMGGELIKFDRAPLDPPYSPAAYLALMKEAAAAGFNAIIVDSVSHMHEGEGGILEMQQEEHKRLGGKDSTKFMSWIKPKAEFKKFVMFLNGAPCHIILCFRAQEKIKMVKDGQGKNIPTPAGWQPIATKGLEYEVTSMLVLPPGSEGVPNLFAEARKMPMYLQQLFDEREQLSEDTGRRLAIWARAEKPVIPAIEADRWEQAQQFAKDQGKAGIAMFASTCSEEEKAAIRLRIKELAQLYPSQKPAEPSGQEETTTNGE